MENNITFHCTLEVEPREDGFYVVMGAYKSDSEWLDGEAGPFATLEVATAAMNALLRSGRAVTIGGVDYPLSYN